MSEHVETLCKYCEAVLDIDYRDIGICPCCLDEDIRDMGVDDDVDYRDNTYYNSEWDIVAEDEY